MMKDSLLFLASIVVGTYYAKKCWREMIKSLPGSLKYLNLDNVEAQEIYWKEMINNLPKSLEHLDLEKVKVEGIYHVDNYHNK